MRSKAAKRLAYKVNSEPQKKANAKYYKANAGKVKKRSAEHYALNKDNYKRKRHESRYNEPFSNKEERLRKQDSRCANLGCRTTNPGKKGWNTDHDHECCSGYKSCGQCIRGELCQSCNKALGLLKDSEARILGLVEYVRTYKKPS